MRGKQNRPALVFSRVRELMWRWVLFLAGCSSGFQTIIHEPANAPHVSALVVPRARLTGSDASGWRAFELFVRAERTPLHRGQHVNRRAADVRSTGLAGALRRRQRAQVRREVHVVERARPSGLNGAQRFGPRAAFDLADDERGEQP